MVVKYTQLPDNKDKAFGGAYSVHDPETCLIRDTSITRYVKEQQLLNHNDIRNNFCNTYREWMFSSHPKIKGWQDYNHLCFTQGTTESFSQFYIRFKESKRLRLAKGEYFYHQMMKSLWFNNRFAWLDEDDVREGDVLLLSVPFSDTGDIPKNLETLLTECDRKNVPVMLDLAYLNLSTNLDIDLTHRCIEYVVTSLSKVFPVENYRIGLRMQRTMFEDQLYVINENNYNYINLMSAYIGTALMNNFDADYIHNKYKDKQNEFCKKYNLEMSPCVYFGIDHNNQYPIYNRGNNTNRLCFSRVWDGRMVEKK